MLILQNHQNREAPQEELFILIKPDRTVLKGPWNLLGFLSEAATMAPKPEAPRVWRPGKSLKVEKKQMVASGFGKVKNVFISHLYTKRGVL